QPEKGEKGDQGPPGESATVYIEDVIPELVKSDEIMEAVRQEVAKQYADNPPAPGEKGESGVDGLGVTNLIINNDGHLIATKTDGSTHDIGRVMGEDGIGFEDATIEYDPQKGLTYRLSNGRRTLEKTIMPPVMEHQGFYEKGMKIKGGNLVTHNGSLWIAKRD